MLASSPSASAMPVRSSVADARCAEGSRGGGPGGAGPAPAPVRVGDRVGRYVVLEWLGAGGMGVVFSAYDNELDRKVALKLLRPNATTESAEQRAARMLREARALA